MDIDHYVDDLIQKLADVRFDIAKQRFHRGKHSVIDEVDDDILNVLIKLNTLVDNSYNFPTGVRKDGTRYFKEY